MSEEPAEQKTSVSDSLRTAIERTLDVTSRERASELLDEVARLGQEAGELLSRRGREARQAVTRAVEEIRPVTEPGLQRLAERVDHLERRIRSLEAARPNPEAEL